MRKRHFFMKKIISVILAGSMLCTVWNMQTFAAEILYDQISTEIVTKGVT